MQGVLMKLKTATLAALMLAACSNPGQQKSASAGVQRPSDAETEAYMRKAESDWATAPIRERTALLQRILADDYVGVGTKGAVRNKQETIAADTAMPSDPGGSSKLNYVHFRHFGDTVLAQGRETGSSSGKPRSLAWTDVWMFRDGKWQIVASQDTVVQPEK